MRNYRPFAAMVGAIATALVVTVPASAAKLGVLSVAPPIKAAKWVKGSPVNMVKKGDSYTFKPGTIHVVEFWATWCGPCRTSIPHITELAKKYKGKVTFTGVSVSEGDPQYVAKVTKFVNEMGAKMNYNVAVDTAPQGGFMSENWMQAAEQRGIPAAFIVGKDGKIAWIGHPMTMDKPLAEIVAGTFNAKAYAEQQRRASMAEEELGKLGRSINELAGKGDFKGAVAKIDAFKTNDPAIAAQLAAVKVRLMTQYDEPGAARYVRDLANGMFKSDPMWLNDTAWGMIGDEPMWKNPDKALALQMAQRAVELTQGKEPALLDTLAMAYFKTGDKAKAIATQEKAVAILNKAGVDAKTKKEYTDRLEMFKKNR